MKSSTISKVVAVLFCCIGFALVLACEHDGGQMTTPTPEPSPIIDPVITAQADETSKMIEDLKNDLEALKNGQTNPDELKKMIDALQAQLDAEKAKGEADKAKQDKINQLQELMNQILLAQGAANAAATVAVTAKGEYETAVALVVAQEAIDKAVADAAKEQAAADAATEAAETAADESHKLKYLEMDIMTAGQFEYGKDSKKAFAGTDGPISISFCKDPSCDTKITLDVKGPFPPVGKISGGLSDALAALNDTDELKSIGETNYTINHDGLVNQIIFRNDFSKNVFEEKGLTGEYLNYFQICNHSQTKEWDIGGLRMVAQTGTESQPTIRYLLADAGVLLAAKDSSKGQCAVFGKDDVGIVVATETKTGSDQQTNDSLFALFRVTNNYTNPSTIKDLKERFEDFSEGPRFDVRKIGDLECFSFDLNTRWNDRDQGDKEVYGGYFFNAIGTVYQHPEFRLEGNDGWGAKQISTWVYYPGQPSKKMFYLHTGEGSYDDFEIIAPPEDANGVVFPSKIATIITDWTDPAGKKDNDADEMFLPKKYFEDYEFYKAPIATTPKVQVLTPKRGTLPVEGVSIVGENEEAMQPIKLPTVVEANVKVGEMMAAIDKLVKTDIAAFASVAGSSDPFTDACDTLIKWYTANLRAYLAMTKEFNAQYHIYKALLANLLTGNGIVITSELNEVGLYLTAADRAVTGAYGALNEIPACYKLNNIVVRLPAIEGAYSGEQKQTR